MTRDIGVVGGKGRLDTRQAQLGHVRGHRISNEVTAMLLAASREDQRSHVGLVRQRVIHLRI